MDRDRVTVQEAARRLGVSEQAIRKRVKRGTLEHDKEQDGRVYVYLDGVADEVDEVVTPNSDALISEMRDRIRYLEEESRRKDHLLAAALERIPAASLEPPRETRDAPEMSSEDRTGAERRKDDTGPEKRSWWQRWFVG